MWKTITRRILLIIPQLFILSILVFILAKLMPGDALTGMTNPKIDQNTIEQLRIASGYYDPWYVQYGRWITNALQGDFGMSYNYKLPVMQVIGPRAINSLALSLLS